MWDNIERPCALGVADEINGVGVGAIYIVLPIDKSEIKSATMHLGDLVSCPRIMSRIPGDNESNSGGVEGGEGSIRWW